MAENQTLCTGQILDNRYRVEALLAAGGMGSVYLGRHVTVGRRVAIKFLHADLVEQDDIVTRFFREAQAAAAICHKNIIEIWDVGTTLDHHPYMVMEYLEGESLADFLRRSGPISLPAACGILEPVLSALGAAHDIGIVHRDIKPDNIFLARIPGDTESVVKVIDFGVSKHCRPDQTKMTVAGTQFGTPEYMAPEQIHGDENLDHRADLYSVGVMMYRMLTGRMPFRGTTRMSLFANVLTEEPVPPEQAYDQFPAEAGPLIMRLLSKNPSERPSSAAAVMKEMKIFPGFEERLTQLREYTSSLREKTFAGGDLGNSDLVEGGADSAGASQGNDDNSARPLSNTPSEWAGSRKNTPSPLVNVPKSHAAKTRLIVVGLFVVLLVGSGILWSMRGEIDDTSMKDNSSPPLVQLPQPSYENPIHPPSPKSIEISLSGLPADVTILYDGAVIPNNPFRVKASDVLGKLETKAPGFITDVRWIMPKKDQTVSMELVPLEKLDSVVPFSLPDVEQLKKPEKKHKTSGKLKDKPTLPVHQESQREAMKKNEKSSGKVNTSFD